MANERRTSFSRVYVGLGALFVALSVLGSCREGALDDRAARPQVAKRIASTAPATTKPAPVARAVPASLEPGYAQSLGFSFAAAPGPASRAEPEVRRMNAVCAACHKSDDHDMHVSAAVSLSCVDCHGGKQWPAGYDVQTITAAAVRPPTDDAFLRLKNAVHVQPRLKEFWARGGANPSASGASTLAEHQDYIRFINPGDLRAAGVACGACHGDIVSRVGTSLMTHGAMLWGAALYNNGSIPLKNSPYGEAYDVDGTPVALLDRKATADDVLRSGTLQFLYPLPRWEITQPGNLLRVFEQGGKRRPIIGVPDPLEDPGRPEVKLSVRGLGTDVRTDPVFIGLQKTRLLDPTLNLMGTNDHPGDYRASGCSACHVVYANDHSPVHSGRWADFGNRGQSWSRDRTVNPGAATQPSPGESPSGREGGHPVRHQFVRYMPTSTCISCHIHPGTNVLNSYLGFMWWDNETDGKFLYPKEQHNPSPDDEYVTSKHNPEGAASRGLWGAWAEKMPGLLSRAGKPAGPNFLTDLTALNKDLTRTQFADFHGHGWLFQAVYKQDRQGRMLDRHNQVVSDITAAKLKTAVDFRWNKAGDELPSGVPVHLKDIHLEKGMHCVDCHFEPDAHGTGKLYGEPRNAITLECEDCHGTVERTSPMLRWLAKESSDKLLDGAFTGAAADDRDRERRLADNRKIIKTLKRVGPTGEPEDEKPRFLTDDGTPARLVQRRSQPEPGQEEWTVVQTRETVSPEGPWVDEKSKAGPDATSLARYAHTVTRNMNPDGTFAWDVNGDWSKQPDKDRDKAYADVAHASTTVSCYACHTSWNTSCFGCHLPMRANQRKPMLHNEGDTTRNFTNYNFQTLRDDVFMLGVDSSVARQSVNVGDPQKPVKKPKVVPVRSACAVLVSSQDANRQWIYTQQQTVSAEGFAGTAFTPYFPHTVRAAETKQCTDCHLSKAGDNNAVMAQLLLQGTNSVNFIGRFAWLGMDEGGVEAVAVTERDEPQAVIGSTLHDIAYPANFKQHEAASRKLQEAHGHEGTVLDVQLRGEYLYAACGPDGFIAYDVANIDNKGFSERIITAPVSPLGQRFYVPSRYATSICSPSTMAIDPTRKPLPENEEAKAGVHPLYSFLYLTDREEGLIVIGNRPGTPSALRAAPGVATLLDGNPRNNFLERALTFNPRDLLKGARHMALWGTYAFVSCDAGLVVLDLNDPLSPKVVRTLGPDVVKHPRKVAFQFRYAFVCDDDGVKILDVQRVLGLVEDPASNNMVIPIIPLKDARDVYVSRTYAYIAAGAEGLVVVDVTKPLRPARAGEAGYIPFDAAGAMNDTTAVRVGMTNTSMFAYVADGRNGLRVVQLTSPQDMTTSMGFSPRPEPHLIAWYPATRGRAVAISEGLDRDRAVDEAGNQLAVFGRRGARPFNREEQEKLYLRKVVDSAGREHRQIYTVEDRPRVPSK